MKTAAPPIACEYETAEGRACPYRAQVKLVLVQTNAKPGISGEPVKFFAHACFGHSQRAKATIPEGIKLESVEEL